MGTERTCTHASTGGMQASRMRGAWEESRRAPHRVQLEAAVLPRNGGEHAAVEDHTHALERQLCTREGSEYVAHVSRGGRGVLQQCARGSRQAAASSAGDRP